MTKALADILSGGSVDASRATFVLTLTAISANVAYAGTILNSVSAISAVLVANPSESQMTQISQKMEVFIGSFVSFVQSQSGLEVVANDPVIINDPQFSAFASDFSKLAQQMEEIRARPNTAPDFFPGVTGTLGEFFMKMASI
jgi:hypothetical protein